MMRYILMIALVMLITACGEEQASMQKTAGKEEKAQAAAKDTPDRDGHSGKELFNYWCQPCHAAGPGHAGTQQLARRLGEEQSVLLERENLTAEYVSHVVRNGFQMMPPFRHTEISDEELEKIALYVSESSKGK